MLTFDAVTRWQDLEDADGSQRGTRMHPFVEPGASWWENLEGAIRSAHGTAIHLYADTLKESERWQVLAAGRDLAHWRGQRFARDQLDLRLVTGPPQWAARAFHARTSGSTLQNAAQHHAYLELAPFIADPQNRLSFANWCVIYGQDLTGVDGLDESTALPLRLEPWEATPKTLRTRDLPDPTRRIEPGVTVKRRAFDDVADPIAQALAALLSSWPCGDSDISIIRAAGGVDDVLSRIGEPATAGDLTFAQAVHWMTDICANGGTHGGEGMRTARQKIWELLAVLAGVTDQRPYPANRIADHGRAIDWSWFSLDAPAYAWLVDSSFALADPARGCAWAVVARGDA